MADSRTRHEPAANASSRLPDTRPTAPSIAPSHVKHEDGLVSHNPNTTKTEDVLEFTSTERTASRTEPVVATDASRMISGGESELERRRDGDRRRIETTAELRPLENGTSEPGDGGHVVAPSTGVTDGAQEANNSVIMSVEANEKDAEKQPDASEGVERPDHLSQSRETKTPPRNLPDASGGDLPLSATPQGDRITKERQTGDACEETPSLKRSGSSNSKDRPRHPLSHTKDRDRVRSPLKKKHARVIGDRFDLRATLKYTPKGSPSTHGTCPPVTSMPISSLGPDASACVEGDMRAPPSVPHKTDDVQPRREEEERGESASKSTIARENVKENEVVDVDDSANNSDRQHVQMHSENVDCSNDHGAPNVKFGGAGSGDRSQQRDHVDVDNMDCSVDHDRQTPHAGDAATPQDQGQIRREKMDCSDEAEQSKQFCNPSIPFTPTPGLREPNAGETDARTSVVDNRGNDSPPVAKRARPATNDVTKKENPGDSDKVQPSLSEPEDAMEISPVQSKPNMQADVLSNGPSPAKNPTEKEFHQRQENIVPIASKPDSNVPESPNSPKQRLTNSVPHPKKRGRSPAAVVQRNVVHNSLPREAMINRAFSGRVELSAYSGHRIVAYVGGQELTGWVLDADVSGMENRSHSEEQENVDAKQEMINTNTSFPADIRLKPRKLPVARRSRRVVPLTKDREMEVDDLGCVPTLITGSDVPKRSVIVIGAGIAGIAAARALKDRGFVVTVLEARRRLGGRIATDWSMGSPVELGAAFIHGCYGNPLSEIAREGDLRTYSPSDVGSLIYANGKRVSPSDDRHAEQVWKALLSRAGSIAKGSLMKHSALDIALGKLLKRLKEEVVDGCSEEVTQLLAWHAANLEAACASEMRDLSAKHYDMDDKSGFSGSHKLVRDGYASIVHALARNLDVHYNSEVIAIQRDVPIHLPATEKMTSQKGNRSFGSKQYQEALLRDVHAESQRSRSVRYLDGVKRKIHSGTKVSSEQECTSQRYGARVIVENGKEYVAESCIVTLPLGVLQKGDVTFLPPLPAWKHDAIHNVGFGLVNKVALRFDFPFWVDVLNGNEDDDEEGPDHIGRVSSEHGVFYMFLSLLRCVGAPILVAITSGRFAEHIERLSDEEVVKMALEALRNMFPSKTMGTLLSHSVTRWKTDRYARGSYSYAKVGTTPQDYTRISEPVGTLSFAGEATHRNHPATAHGAFMSGIREAARLIERSDFSEEQRRKYARELFLMQEPHASFEKAVTCNGGSEMGNGNEDSIGTNRYPMTNGNSHDIPNGNTARRKKRNSQSRRR